MTPVFTSLALVLTGWALANSAQATACMVMGERTAVVRSSEGERSPVFLATSCESLRLVHGKAMVSWVTRDGKPRMQSVGALGVDGLPQGRADDAAASTVWSELTSKREVHRAAYTRSIAAPPYQALYVPQDGLALDAHAGDVLRLTVHKDGKEAVVLEQTATVEGAFVLTRKQLQPGLAYGLALTQDGMPSFHTLKPVSLAEQRRLDGLYPKFRSDLADPISRALVLALWYEQLKLGFNSQTVLHAIRKDVQADRTTAQTQ